MRTRVSRHRTCGVMVYYNSADLEAELDMEYRYWCFVEGHPAHVPLPTESRTEAMDALKWSYTGGSQPHPSTESPLTSPQIRLSPLLSLLPCPSLLRSARSS